MTSLRSVNQSAAQAPPALDERQRMVLRALVTAYVADANPVGSTTISYLLPVRLSSASVRTTMSELADLGLISKSHASAGREPTSSGLRFFVDQLLDPRELEAYERRSLNYSFETADSDRLVHRTSQLLSEHSRQLGFVLPARLDRLMLRHISLVRLSTERILVVVVTRSGETYRRIIEDAGSQDQPDLERMAAALTERVVGKTLAEVRASLASELRGLRQEADRLLARALALGLRMVAEALPDAENLVIASHLALLDQPELADPDRLREIYAAVETQEQLVSLLDRLLESSGVSVALGEELAEPGLRHFALVAAPYGAASGPLGVLGVIGPRRMDYRHVIPLVSYCSERVTEKLEP